MNFAAAMVSFDLTTGSTISTTASEAGLGLFSLCAIASGVTSFEASVEVSLSISGKGGIMHRHQLT